MVSHLNARVSKVLASLPRTVLRQNRKYFGSYPGQPEEKLPLQEEADGH